MFFHMYPEEIYQIKSFLPRELLRPISFNIAKGLVQDALKFPKQVRSIIIEGYESYYVTCGKFCWWITLDLGILQSIISIIINYRYFNFRGIQLQYYIFHI